MNTTQNSTIPLQTSGFKNNPKINPPYSKIRFVGQLSQLTAYLMTLNKN